MAFTSWRGVVGCIKPTMRPGGLEELIRMLPEGIGVIPLFLNIRAGTEAEFKRAVAPYEPLVRELAEAGCDLIHPEGAPPFMLLGFKGEADHIKTWEKQYKVPFFTSGSNHVRALRALKAKKVVGATYFVYMWVTGLALATQANDFLVTKSSEDSGFFPLLKNAGQKRLEFSKI